MLSLHILINQKCSKTYTVDNIPKSQQERIVRIFRVNQINISDVSDKDNILAYVLSTL